MSKPTPPFETNWSRPEGMRSGQVTLWAGAIKTTFRLQDESQYTQLRELLAAVHAQGCAQGRSEMAERLRVVMDGAENQPKNEKESPPCP